MSCRRVCCTRNDTLSAYNLSSLAGLRKDSTRLLDFFWPFATLSMTHVRSVTQLERHALTRSPHRALKSGTDKMTFDDLDRCLSQHCADMSISLHATAYHDEHQALREVVNRLGGLEVSHSSLLAL